MAKRHKLSKSSLLWFVKSRPLVLVPEIRRRFELDDTDEVSPIGVPEGRAFVGLPPRSARLLEDLVRENRIGLEYSVDLHARMVLGVYAFDLLKIPIGPPPRPFTNGSRPPLPPPGTPAGESESAAGETPILAVLGRPDRANRFRRPPPPRHQPGRRSTQGGPPARPGGLEGGGRPPGRGGPPGGAPRHDHAAARQGEPGREQP